MGKSLQGTTLVDSVFAPFDFSCVISLHWVASCCLRVDSLAHKLCKWLERAESNRLPSAYQTDTLPLSYVPSWHQAKELNLE
jgi:hypothetical protein